MPRPFRCRRIQAPPNCRLFKPAGVPLDDLETNPLQLDELEAMRLVDLSGLYQEDAAVKLGVSRQTLGNILESARKKVADALVNSKALSIGGGTCHSSGEEARKCPRCRCRKHRSKNNEGEKA